MPRAERDGRLGVIGKCGRSGKRMFASPAEVAVNNSHNPQKIRIYRCPHCHAYHATRRV